MKRLCRTDRTHNVIKFCFFLQRPPHEGHLLITPKTYFFLFFYLKCICFLAFAATAALVVMDPDRISGLRPEADVDPPGTLRLLRNEAKRLQKEVPDNQLHAQWNKALDETLQKKILEYENFMKESKPPRVCRFCFMP